jgi:hypothetical protein
MIMKSLCKQIQGESGTALLASVLLISLITGAGLTALTMTSVSLNIASNLLPSKQAFYLAEAGIQHGKTFLSQNRNNWTTYASPQAQTLLPYTSLASTGGYSVTVQDGGGGSLLINSTGTGAGNAQVVIASLVTAAFYTPHYAITTGKNLTINVDTSIVGASGGVHANGNLVLVNSPIIHGDATASGSYTASGSPTIGGMSGGAKDPDGIPPIKPTDFYAARDYLLASDGIVYDTNGVAQAVGKGKSGWNGWQYASGVWTLSGNKGTINGKLYVQGDVNITATFGTGQGVPPLWITSIIATGSITVNSNSINVRNPTPADGTLYHPVTKDILFLAGGDLKITAPTNGNYQMFQGMLLAHEQFNVTGYSTTTITGPIVAEDGATQSTVVTGDNFFTYSNSYLDTPTISYDGTVSNGKLQAPNGSVKIMTWQVTK